MSIVVSGSSLFVSNLAGIDGYRIEGATPQPFVSVARATAPNGFLVDPSGERMTESSAGLIARSFTEPDHEGHWASAPSSVALYDTSLAPVATYSVGQRLDDRSLALSPDGTRLASISRGAGVVVFDARTGAVVSEHEGSIGSGVSYSPDGRRIAAGDTDQDEGALYLLDFGSSEVVRHALPHPKAKVPLYDSPFESCFSADGALVAFTCAAWGRRGVVVYDVATRLEAWSAGYDMEGAAAEEEEAWNALRVRFAAKGCIVLVGVEEGIRAYRSADGTELTRLACEGAEGLHFAADDERAQVWVVADGAPIAIPYPGDWK